MARQRNFSMRYLERAENILLAQTQKTGHFSTGLRVLQRGMEMHLSRGQNRRAGASLSHHDRKTFRSNNGSHLNPSLKSPDMGQLDLQQVRRLFFKHRKRIFRGTDALLSGDGNPNRAPEFSETLQIAPRQRLLGIGDLKSAELR